MGRKPDAGCDCSVHNAMIGLLAPLMDVLFLALKTSLKILNNMDPINLSNGKI